MRQSESVDLSKRRLFSFRRAPVEQAQEPRVKRDRRMRWKSRCSQGYVMDAESALLHVQAKSLKWLVALPR